MVGVLVVFLGAMMIVPLLAVLCGAFSGWVVNYWGWSQPILDVLTLVGIKGVALWQVGATLGFVGAFFRSGATLGFVSAFFRSYASSSSK